MGMSNRPPVRCVSFETVLCTSAGIVQHANKQLCISHLYGEVMIPQVLHLVWIRSVFVCIVEKSQTKHYVRPKIFATNVIGKVLELIFQLST